jgi:hypothetical protein
VTSLLGRSRAYVDNRESPPDASQSGDRIGCSSGPSAVSLVIVAVRAGCAFAPQGRSG